MTWLPVLPIAVPLLTACIALLGWTSAAWQRWVCITGSLVSCGVALALIGIADEGRPLVVAVGDWTPPLGIVLVADRFSAVLALLAAASGLVATIYASAESEEERLRFFQLPLMQLLVMGVSGAFLTGDIFNLYVWFEVLLMASFVLLTLGGTRGQLDGGVKYVTMNLLSSALFLCGTGILYGFTGTLTMADLSRVLAEPPANAPIEAVALLFLVAFGIKAALVPLFFWLPASYATPPFAVSALFAALLTKVGMYSIFRVFTTVFGAQQADLQPLFAWLAGISMVVGVLGAASQTEIRRILAFHSVSQMGYILMGLAIGTPAAIGAAIFFFLHHGVVKSALFLVAGAVHRRTGSNELRDPRVAGVFRASPFLAAVFFVAALSLAGIPPLSGFVGKLGLVAGGVDAGAHWLVGTALAVGLLTTFSMVKIWGEAFWRERPNGDTPRGTVPHAMIWVPAAMAVVAIGLGVLGGPVLDYCVRAGHALVDRGAYERAVIETTPLSTAAPAEPIEEAPTC
jgi:multicomponent Na+:H+ antiporter subunit D